MWSYFKNQKISILTVLAGLIYAFMVVSSFWEGRDDFLRGWHEADHAEKSVFYANKEPYSSYFLTVTPKKGFASYPDSLLNLTNNRSIRTCNQKFMALAPDKLPSTAAKWYNALCNILMLLFVTTYIVIPFHFFRFMSLIKKNIFFEKENIRLLRWLGTELVIVYFGMVLYNFLNYKINASLFSFSEYSLVMDSMDGIWFLFGVVVLLIAEILSKALVLKEEQELTI